MIDYRLRVYRRFPFKQMRQVVIYLQETGSELVQQNNFTLERTRHEFDIIRLWEQPTEGFLQSPGLLPFAVLCQTDARTQVLQQVAQSLNQISDTRKQNNLLASAYILAGLVLERETIRRILRKDDMRESVTYQEILEEGREKGREETVQQIITNMLQERMDINLIARITDLSIEEIQQIQSTQT